MRAPAFWRRGAPDARARLLQPFSILYGAIAAHRMTRAGLRGTAPILCIGNFTAGGAGKTPAAIACAKILRAMGEAPAFLSRGFGGALSSPEPLQVDPSLHEAADVGDEPLLLARCAPAFICTDRVAGAEAAAHAGASIVIMDDGLQNPSLRKDVSLAVVDGATGLGNGLCIPAGPLRAPMRAQWPLIDAVVIVGAGAAGETVAREARRAGREVLFARLAPIDGERLRGRRVFAFAGIGRPEKFFDTLRDCGADLVGAREFDDHQMFETGDLRRLAAEATAARAEIVVTTEKDAARISPGDMPGLDVLKVEMAFDDEPALRALLSRLRRE
ncbi:MAG: tetraacyldisaccharide 4-kinase [Hyphomicrobiales bacterium]|nr:tetraacyldisaccharide 4-kinase [Hyphomicrobiales bacterium]